MNIFVSYLFSVSCGKIITVKWCYDDKNILINLNDDDVRYFKLDDIDKIIKDGNDEFPIKGSILRVLIEFWTHYYACNTIRYMITILHQHHIYNGFPKFTRQGHWRIVDETMKVAEKKREIKFPSFK